MTAPSSPLMQKLASLPICNGLTAAEAAEIFEICEEVSLKKGEVLFREGQPGDAIYAVLDGEVEVLKGEGNGAQTLARVCDGAVLGEMSLIGGGRARTATASAVSDTRLLKISADRFSGLLQKSDVAALKIVFNFAQVMSTRLQQANEKLVELAGKTQRREELMDFQKILSHWSF